MLIIGLTGRIASGKSTVAEKFKELGINIINADAISKEITRPDSLALKKIVKYFGSSILDKNNKLNRKMLRDIIFKDKSKRLWLENLLHPLIRQEIENKITKCSSEYCVVEIPLLTDKTHYPYLNRILLITLDETTQIERLLQRDNISKEDALLILASQENESKYKEIADDILENNSSVKSLNEKVLQLHKLYIELNQKS